MTITTYESLCQQKKIDLVDGDPDPIFDELSKWITKHAKDGKLLASHSITHVYGSTWMLSAVFDNRDLMILTR